MYNIMDSASRFSQNSCIYGYRKRAFMESRFCSFFRPKTPEVNKAGLFKSAGRHYLAESSLEQMDNGEWLVTKRQEQGQQKGVGTGFRGGNWNNDTSYARTSDRNNAANVNTNRNNNYGARSARTLYRLAGI